MDKVEGLMENLRLLEKEKKGIKVKGEFGWGVDQRIFRRWARC